MTTETQPATEKKTAPASSKKGESKCQHELNPWPEYIQERIALWDKYMAKYKAELASRTTESIQITLPDGKIKEGQSWRTTPFEIAQKISKGLAEEVVIAKVDGEVWDMDRPLERNCHLALLKFDDDDAKQVFWHSTAHVLGEAMERFYGGMLCYGPPIQDGFYYDMFLDHCGCGDRTTIRSGEDFPRLEEIMKCAVKDKQPFERLELTKVELLDMFKYNEFKIRILNEKVTTPTTTVYRCGPLIDLCRGPHVRHTGKIKAFQVTKVGNAYWEGRAEAESLQRIYGISFPDPKQLKEWQKFQEEAAARDHRKLGRDQELFIFHELSPGSAFFFPKGAYIYNTLVDFIRKEYRKRGFTEVISPNMYNSRLWEQSGHWQHYSKNIFKIECEKEQFGLKPMNCPGHCLMFDSRPRTFKELPLRFADFGVLHRNELAGALSGLTRVRRFQQDDAHIFCRSDQLGQEMIGALQFLRRVYEDVFGFNFQLYLSTRPDDYMGELSEWNSAEEQLKIALESFKAESGQDYKINPGDGAFYGPKIDIVITDALRRPHQCATIQLDFQLPQRFDLHYTDANSERQRPVMIHRAILGSVERMIAILTENYGGKWPFWLSPRQVMVVPVHPTLDEYAVGIRNEIYEAGYECDVDTDHGDTFNKKVRLAQLAQYNFILVVGEKEKTNGTVNVRTRDNKVHGELSMPDLLERFRKLKENYVKNSEEW